MKKQFYSKKLFSLLLALSLAASFAIGVSAAGGEIVTPIRTELDGKVIMTENTSALLIGGVTYVPLRRFCEELGAASLTWYDAERKAQVRTAGLDISVAEGQQYITVNERHFYSGASNLLRLGTLYVPVRSIAKAYGLSVNWCATNDSSLGYVSLISEMPRAEHAEDVYDHEVLYWLSRIISAESRGESLIGQIAVGNVVLNRTRSANFPSTVYDVIFDTKFGVQFTPIVNGTIYEEPAESSIIAAKICLEGYTVSESILYFMNKALSANMWVADNRPYVMTLGNHTFYS